jgi:hypothetical protein
MGPYNASELVCAVAISFDVLTGADSIFRGLVRLWGVARLRGPSSWGYVLNSHSLIPNELSLMPRATPIQSCYDRQTGDQVKCYRFKLRQKNVGS